MKTLYRALGLMICGAALGAISNEIGPKQNRISWIRGVPQGGTPDGALKHGDLSLNAMKTLSESPYTIVLDARDRDDFCRGHIPNAISLPVRKFDEEFPKQSLPLMASKDSGQVIIIYCTGGDCEDSKQMKERLAGFQLDNTMIYEGGWQEWDTAGMPGERCE